MDYRENERISVLSVKDAHHEFAPDGSLLVFMKKYGSDFLACKLRAQKLIDAACTVISSGGVGIKVPVKVSSDPDFLLRPTNFTCDDYELLFNAAALAEYDENKTTELRNRAYQQLMTVNKIARVGRFREIDPALLAGQPGSRRDPDGGPARPGAPENNVTPLQGARKIAADANASNCKHLQAEITRLNSSSGAW